MIASILSKTKLMPSHPNNTEIESKLELRSRCKNSCIVNEILSINFKLYI